MRTRCTTVRLALLLAVALLVLPAGAEVWAQTQYLEITIPVYHGYLPAERPPVADYEWQTFAGSPDPAEVRFIMVSAEAYSGNYNTALEYIRNNPNAPEWSPWEPYAPPGVGTHWTSPPLDLGPYVFAVQGRDGQGVAETEFDLVRNARYVRVVDRSHGPFMEVTGDLIEWIRTTFTTTPVTEVDAPPGSDISFCLTADAEHYGGVVEGYRFGWDIVDPDDDGAWGTGFVPYPGEMVCSSPRNFAAGSHMFYAEAIDNDGFKARVPILVSIVASPLPVEPTTWGRIKALYTE